MKLAKSLLLGSAAALVATAGSAADLPATKAAPVSYVKVCDAYGAGFFYIPGTDTCIKVGGRVRADFAMSGRQNVYASNAYAAYGKDIVGGYIYNYALTATQSSANLGYQGSTAHPYNGQLAVWTFDTLGAAVSVAGGAYGASASRGIGDTITGNASTSTRFGYVAANGVAAQASSIYGWEARARVDLDARTATSMGTVQAVSSIRLARTTGMLDQVGPAQSSSGAGATLEAAYIRFAGFTFGVAKDNFSFMPSTFYGAGHWSSFANGAKQIAYTAVLGGGFSATLAMQDATDTTAGGANALGTLVAGSTANANEWVLSTVNNYGSAEATSNGAPAYSYNKMPQVNGRVDFDQAWGTVSAMGAVGSAVGVNSSGTYDKSKSTYAVAAGLKLNLPMIAAGDVLWLNGGYSDGMTEYTTNWTSFKSSDVKRNVGGYVVNHPSWVVTSNGIETVKAWNAAAVFTHFWAPQWRHSFLATYGEANGTTTSKQLAWGQTGAFGDAKVWNLGTQLTWLPTKDFEIGVDVLYARVEQDVRRITGVNTPGVAAAASSAPAQYQLTGATYASKVTRESMGNFTGRLRVERTF